jgi:hypothetical protein
MGEAREAPLAEFVLAPHSSMGRPSSRRHVTLNPL